MHSVLIVESPSLEDITTEDRQGEPIHKLLRLLRIPSTYRPIHNVDLLDTVLNCTIKEHDLVHLCAHGSNDGLHFTDGTSISWQALGLLLIGRAARRFVIVSACNSAWVDLQPAETLAKYLNSVFKEKMPIPRCVLTFLGSPHYPDAVLAWGIFYRRLGEELEKSSTTVYDCPPKVVFNALQSVKSSGLKLKICAVFWNDRKGKYFDISPWKVGEKDVSEWEKSGQLEG